MAAFEYIENAWWLLAILPPSLGYVLYLKWKRSALENAGDARLISARLPTLSASRSHVKAGLVLAAVLLLVFGLMNRQTPVEQAGGQLGGLDVMIALDVSNSMMAADLPPNRLEKARLFASKLMDTLQGNRVGIVAFAGQAFVQLPLTTDISAARIYLQSVNTGLIPVQGTNIFEALQACRGALDPAEKKYKAVVLITDGEEQDEQALSAAKALRDEGVVLLTLGVGTPDGAALLSETGEPRRRDNGAVIVTTLNEKLLQELATATSGTYRRLVETEPVLNAVVAELNAMDKKPLTNTLLINFRSYSHAAILLAFLLLLAELLIPYKSGKGLGLSRRFLRSAGFFLPVLLSGFAANAQSTADLLRKANRDYLDQKFAEAKKGYEQVLRLEPGNAVARFNLGNLAYRSKDYAAAATNFQLAAKAGGDATLKAGASNNIGLSYANAADKEKDLPKAIESFKQSLRFNPYDDEVRNNLHRAMQEQKTQEQQPPQNSDNAKNKQPPPSNKFNPQQANEKLQALQQEEKRLRERMNKPQAGGVKEGEW